MKINAKPTIFSGVKPSGDLHLGNYLGAISQWAELQADHNCIFCVVDYHAITVKQDPEELKKRTIEIAKIYLASGIESEASMIFKQSDITAHTELCWILNCIAARMGDMNKMTQFKDKAGQRQETVSVGLYDYPVLMAADILLYNTDIVPVGEDQVQHVELTRDLAKRVNARYGEVLKIPDYKLRREGARIMGLQNPEKKMSKSDNAPADAIALLDNPLEAAKKIKRAVTDSGSEVKFDKEKKPAVSNLLTIYSLLANKSIKELEKQYIGRGYGNFKSDLAEVVSSFLSDFQKKFHSYSDQDILDLFRQNADKLRPIAEETLRKVKEQVGLL